METLMTVAEYKKAVGKAERILLWPGKGDGSRFGVVKVSKAQALRVVVALPADAKVAVEILDLDGKGGRTALLVGSAR